MNIVVDAHEDIAWNMLSFGRDYTRPLRETRRIEADGRVSRWNGTALLGWDAWQHGGVAVIFATLHAAPYRRREGAWDTQVYHDSEGAHRLYSRQLDLYERLSEEHQDKFRLVKTAGQLERVLARWEEGGPGEPPIGLVILMEGADPVRAPEELEEWYARGVRIVGPAWSGTRYAGGTGEPGPFSDEGWALLEVMAELNLILDLSHLAEEAALQALDHFPGTLIASHSNARALVGRSAAPERHLADRTIRMIGERGGVIGIVPYNKFLDGEWQQSEGRERLSRYDLVAQIDHICQLTGSADHAGLGSDFDGGLGLEHVPAGFDSVADLVTLNRELGETGYSEDQIKKILAGNWLRVLRQTLPED